MNVFFCTTHTFYLKVCLPLLITLCQKGMRVSLFKNTPNFLGYSPRKYSRNPVRNTCINLAACQYVASLIGYDDDFSKIRTSLKFTPGKKMKDQDVIIGTVKDIDELINFKKQGARVYALGYQHMPVLFSLNTKIQKKEENSLCEEVFLGENAFAGLHGFAKFIHHAEVTDYSFCNFLYLDKVYQRYTRESHEGSGDKPYVLIFHPGGYRHVVTSPGDNKRIAYEKQKSFLKTVCEPVLKAGLTPVVKVHPLYAIYHSAQDMETILAGCIQDDPSFKDVIIINQAYWPYAFASRAIVTFGSSGVYELFAAGIKNVLVCDFLGKARSEKFTMFDALMINSEKDYRSLFEDIALLERRFDNMNGLLNDVYSAYASLHNGRAVSSVLQEVTGT